MGEQIRQLVENSSINKVRWHEGVDHGDVCRDAEGCTGVPPGTMAGHGKLGRGNLQQQNAVGRSTHLDTLSRHHVSP